MDEEPQPPKVKTKKKRDTLKNQTRNQFPEDVFCDETFDVLKLSERMQLHLKGLHRKRGAKDMGGKQPPSRGRDREKEGDRGRGRETEEHTKERQSTRI